jgi:hypothetical protein
MIILLGASAIYLTALQASINAPREAFAACLKASIEKATAQKVAGDGYDAFVRAACNGQMDSLKSAVVSFDMKNKMSKKDAASDAQSMIDDFVAGSAEHYRYMNKSDPIASAAPAKPVATQASVPVKP